MHISVSVKPHKVHGDSSKATNKRNKKTVDDQSLDYKERTKSQNEPTDEHPPSAELTLSATAKPRKTHKTHTSHKKHKKHKTHPKHKTSNHSLHGNETSPANETSINDLLPSFNVTSNDAAKGHKTHKTRKTNKSHKASKPHKTHKTHKSHKTRNKSLNENDTSPALNETMDKHPPLDNHSTNATVKRSQEIRADEVISAKTNDASLLDAGKHVSLDEPPSSDNLTSNATVKNHKTHKAHKTHKSHKSHKKHKKSKHHKDHSKKDPARNASLDEPQSSDDLTVKRKQEVVADAVVSSNTNETELFDTERPVSLAKSNSTAKPEPSFESANKSQVTEGNSALYNQSLRESNYSVTPESSLEAANKSHVTGGNSALNNQSLGESNYSVTPESSFEAANKSHVTEGSSALNNQSLGEFNSSVTPESSFVPENKTKNSSEVRMLMEGKNALKNHIYKHEYHYRTYNLFLLV